MNFQDSNNIKIQSLKRYINLYKENVPDIPEHQSLIGYNNRTKSWSTFNAKLKCLACPHETDIYSLTLESFIFVEGFNSEETDLTDFFHVKDESVEEDDKYVIKRVYGEVDLEEINQKWIETYHKKSDFMLKEEDFPAMGEESCIKASVLIWFGGRIMVHKKTSVRIQDAGKYSPPFAKVLKFNDGTWEDPADAAVRGIHTMTGISIARSKLKAIKNLGNHKLYECKYDQDCRVDRIETHFDVDLTWGSISTNYHGWVEIDDRLMSKEMQELLTGITGPIPETDKKASSMKGNNPQVKEKQKVQINHPKNFYTHKPRRYDKQTLKNCLNSMNKVVSDEAVDLMYDSMWRSGFSQSIFERKLSLIENLQNKGIKTAEFNLDSIETSGSSVHCCYRSDNLDIQANLIEVVTNFQSVNWEFDCVRCYLNWLGDKLSKIPQLPNECYHVFDLMVNLRHEIMHNLVFTGFMLHVVPDRKFCDVFPGVLTSERTPDSIFVSDQNILILESAVSEASGRAYFRKGAGTHESKYQREIDELKAVGYDVHYEVILFDIDNNFQVFNQGIVNLSKILNRPLLKRQEIFYIMRRVNNLVKECKSKNCTLRNYVPKFFSLYPRGNLKHNNDVVFTDGRLDTFVRILMMNEVQEFTGDVEIMVKIYFDKNEYSCVSNESPTGFMPEEWNDLLTWDPRSFLNNAEIYYFDENQKTYLPHHSQLTEVKRVQHKAIENKTPCSCNIEKCLKGGDKTNKYYPTEDISYVGGLDKPVSELISTFKNRCKDILGELSEHKNLISNHKVPRNLKDVFKKVNQSYIDGLKDTTERVKNPFRVPIFDDLEENVEDRVIDAIIDEDLILRQKEQDIKGLQIKLRNTTDKLERKDLGNRIKAINKQFKKRDNFLQVHADNIVGSFSIQGTPVEMEFSSNPISYVKDWDNVETITHDMDRFVHEMFKRKKFVDGVARANASWKEKNIDVMNDCLYDFPEFSGWDFHKKETLSKLDSWIEKIIDTKLMNVCLLEQKVARVLLFLSGKNIPKGRIFKTEIFKGVYLLVKSGLGLMAVERTFAFRIVSSIDMIDDEIFNRKTSIEKLHGWSLFPMQAWSLDEVSDKLTTLYRVICSMSGFKSSMMSRLSGIYTANSSRTLSNIVGNYKCFLASSGELGCPEALVSKVYPNKPCLICLSALARPCQFLSTEGDTDPKIFSGLNTDFSDIAEMCGVHVTMPRAPVNSSMEKKKNLIGIDEKVNASVEIHKNQLGCDNLYLENPTTKDLVEKHQLICKDICQLLGKAAADHIICLGNAGNFISRIRNISKTSIAGKLNFNGSRSMTEPHKRTDNWSAFLKHLDTFGEISQAVSDLGNSSLDFSLTQEDVVEQSLELKQKLHEFLRSKGLNYHKEVQNIISDDLLHRGNIQCKDKDPKGYTFMGMNHSEITLDNYKVILTQYCCLWFFVTWKQQYMANREIYATASTTKLRQTPSELYGKVVCEFLFNEFISIPADQRPEEIRKLFFHIFNKLRKKWNYKKRITEDKTKWGPYMMITIMLHFLKGMSHLFDAKVYFFLIDMFEDMLNCKAYVTTADVIADAKEKINHEEWKELFSWETTIRNKKDMNKSQRHVRKGVINEVGQGKLYRRRVVESFVMGIFNMWSSAPHATIALLMNMMKKEILDLLEPLFQDHMDKAKREDPNCLDANTPVMDFLFIMGAHSDDSAAVCAYTHSFMIKPLLDIYQMLCFSFSTKMNTAKSGVHDERGYMEFLSQIFKGELPYLQTIKEKIQIFKEQSPGGTYASSMSLMLQNSCKAFENGADKLTVMVNSLLGNVMLRELFGRYSHKSTLAGGSVLLIPEIACLDINRFLYLYNMKFHRKNFVYCCGCLGVNGIKAFSLKTMKFRNETEFEISEFRRTYIEMMNEVDYNSFTAHHITCNNILWQAVRALITFRAPENSRARAMRQVHVVRKGVLSRSLMENGCVISLPELQGEEEGIDDLDTFMANFGDNTQQWAMMESLDKKRVITPQYESHPVKPIFVATGNKGKFTVRLNDASNFVSRHFEPQYNHLTNAPVCSPQLQEEIKSILSSFSDPELALQYIEENYCGGIYRKWVLQPHKHGDKYISGSREYNNVMGSLWDKNRRIQSPYASMNLVNEFVNDNRGPILNLLKVIRKLNRKFNIKQIMSFDVYYRGKETKIGSIFSEDVILSYWDECMNNQIGNCQIPKYHLHKNQTWRLTTHTVLCDRDWMILEVDDRSKLVSAEVNEGSSAFSCSLFHKYLLSSQIKECWVTINNNERGWSATPIFHFVPNGIKLKKFNVAKLPPHFPNYIASFYGDVGFDGEKNKWRYMATGELGFDLIDTDNNSEIPIELITKYNKTFMGIPKIQDSMFLKALKLMVGNMNDIYDYDIKSALHPMNILIKGAIEIYKETCPTELRNMASNTSMPVNIQCLSQGLTSIVIETMYMDLGELINGHADSLEKIISCVREQSLKMPKILIDFLLENIKYSKLEQFLNILRLFTQQHKEIIVWMDETFTGPLAPIHLMRLMVADCTVEFPVEKHPNRVAAGLWRKFLTRMRNLGWFPTDVVFEMPKSLLEWMKCLKPKLTESELEKKFDEWKEITKKCPVVFDFDDVEDEFGVKEDTFLVTPITDSVQALVFKEMPTHNDISCSSDWVDGIGPEELEIIKSLEIKQDKNMDTGKPEMMDPNKFAEQYYNFTDLQMKIIKSHNLESKVVRIHNKTFICYKHSQDGKQLIFPDGIYCRRDENTLIRIMEFNDHNISQGMPQGDDHVINSRSMAYCIIENLNSTMLGRELMFGLTDSAVEQLINCHVKMTLPQYKSIEVHYDKLEVDDIIKGIIYFILSCIDKDGFLTESEEGNKVWANFTNWLINSYQSDLGSRFKRRA